LIQPLILLLLVTNVSPDGFFVPSYRVDEEASGPKVLPHEVALALSIDPGQMDRALTLDEADNLGHRIFRRDRKKHMDVIRH